MWREVEDEECSGFVVEISDVLDVVWVLILCDNIFKFFLKWDCFVLVVEKFVLNEVDERRILNFKVEDVNNVFECIGNDFNVENEGESLNKFEVFEIELLCFNVVEDEDG